MAQVLIPDYIGQQVIAGARALARADRVTLATWVRGAQTGAFKSRYFHDVCALETPPRRDPGGYVDAVANLVADRKVDAVVPFGLQAYDAFAHHSQGRDLPVMVAPPDVFDRLNDKSRATDLARELGIDAPRVLPAGSADDVRALASEARFPVVVKVCSGSGVAEGLRYANDGEELNRAWNELYESSSAGNDALAPPMVQEFVPGYIHDACTFTVHGEPVQILTQIRKLMYPIYGGVGAVNVTTHDDELAAIARRLLEASEYHGPAQIEFKKDSRDGRYKFIEFNPKMWGTLDLSISVGLSFPEMVRDYLLGRPLPRDRAYRAGVRYNFWLPLAVLSYVQLVRTYGARAFRPLAPAVESHHGMDWKDPRPVVFNLLMTVRRLLGGKLVEVNANLPRELINGPQTW